MTQAHAPGPAPAAPFAAILRATVVPMSAAVPVIVAVFWITRGSAGGLGALLGACIAVVFFASGLSVLAVGLFWQLCQVVAFMRLRQRVYDQPADQPDDELAQRRVP